MELFDNETDVGINSAVYMLLDGGFESPEAKMEEIKKNMEEGELPLQCSM